MKLLLRAVLLPLLLNALSFGAFSQENELKYFVVQGKLTPEVTKLLVENPADPTAGARKSIKSIPGAILVDYYLEVGTAQNLAIVALPDSSIAAALVYQRLSTGGLTDIKVREILPSNKVKEMLKVAKSLN